MVRTIGIDPGTKSMDICGIEDGFVYYEESVETSKIARDPGVLIELIEKAKPFDLIAGPSGYGVEVTYLEEIPINYLEEWYYQNVLLTKKNYIKEAMDDNVFGAFLYYAMAESVKEMKRRDWPVCFIPGVINLTTVPDYRKVNKIDMGTADKLAVTALAVLDHVRNQGLELEKSTFILAELGFGYNSVIGVSNGRVVDGIGGTTINGPGFLTISSIDAELVQMVGEWSKKDVFLGGASTISNTETPKELIDCVGDEERCDKAWNAMMEGVEKAISSMKVSVPNSSELLLSGRLTKLEKVKKYFKSEYNYEINILNDLDGVKKVKKTAQGYALIANGLKGGIFGKLIEQMGIKEAKGFPYDHIYHPKGIEARNKLKDFQ